MLAAGRSAGDLQRITVTVRASPDTGARRLQGGHVGCEQHVRYIHDKFKLVDPLSEDPIVITGSANFSKASTISNDENMLLIRGNTRVADIYLTTFMRLFNHDEFRAAVSKTAPGRAALSAVASAGVIRGRRYLDPSSSWVSRWYAPGTSRVKERRLFAGTS